MKILLAIPRTAAPVASKTPEDEAAAVDGDTFEDAWVPTPAEDAGGAPSQGAATSDNLQEDLVNLLGNGEDKQAWAQIADAGEDWGLPVKTKKKKKGNDDGAAPSPIDPGTAGGDDGGLTTTIRKKKARNKK
ncbi:hypothetical protein EST38_g10356 [Candolleomyces aberdarensis]|uniref:Uncharacterized protein n=1 Tax=Candolleomyces aberdarensis TaxID=2316362 RepID=A0A4V1Q2L4_9AGAR|nr:hypothetical protein EST38_g10356 [Candolleomyces aberdarensis]